MTHIGNKVRAHAFQHAGTGQIPDNNQAKFSGQADVFECQGKGPLNDTAELMRQLGLTACPGNAVQDIQKIRMPDKVLQPLRLDSHSEKAEGFGIGEFHHPGVINHDEAFLRNIAKRFKKIEFIIRQHYSTHIHVGRMWQGIQVGDEYLERWYSRPDLNGGPPDPQSGALTY